MKGLIALLLTWMMTGMVIGQQPQSSVNNDTSAEPRLLRKFLLVMNEDYLQALKEYGSLQAEIAVEDQRGIDHIVFHGSERNSQRDDLKPFSINYSNLTNNGRLEFTLTDSLIQMMRQTGLRYVLRPEEIGRFTEVVVFYEGQLAGAPTNSSSQAFSQLPIRPTNGPKTADHDSFLQPAMPVVQNGGRRENPLQLPESNPSNDPSFTPRLSTLPPRRESSLMQNVGQSTALDNQNQALDRRFTTTNPGHEPNGRSASNDPVSRSEGGSMNPIRSTIPSNDSIESRIEQNRLLQQIENLAADNAQLKQWFLDQRNQNIALETLLNKTEQALVASQQTDYPRRASGLTGDSFDALRTAGNYTPLRSGNRSWEDDSFPSTSDPTFPSYPTTQDRLVSLPQPTANPPTLEINGPGTSATQLPLANATSTIDAKLLEDNKKLRKEAGALWFIMLCSVGLNFYLSWMARGFYVRYEELADDIRESFLSSN